MSQLHPEVAEALRKMLVEDSYRDSMARTHHGLAPTGSSSGGWHPIATAPLDQPILLSVVDRGTRKTIVGSHISKLAETWPAHSWWVDGANCAGTLDDRCPPTHWMPLPDPPPCG